MYQTRDVPLSPQAEKYYKQLKNQMLIETSGEQITAVNAAAGMNKLLQISGGAVYTDTKEVVRFDLRRLDYRENLIDITYQVNVQNMETLENIIYNLKKIYPKITVTYLDQSSVPSI